jgi:hypothetical protein
MDNNFKQGLIKSLEQFSNGIPQEITASSPINIEHIKWLYEAGLLKGINASTIHPNGEHFLDLVITLKGAEFLEQGQKEIAQRPSREATYEKNYPMRSKVVVGIAVSLLAAFFIYVFGWIAH